MVTNFKAYEEDSTPPQTLNSIPSAYIFYFIWKMGYGPSKVLKLGMQICVDYTRFSGWGDL
jgi:hypothetical protein